MKFIFFWSRGTQSEQYNWFAEFSRGWKVELDSTFSAYAFGGIRWKTIGFPLRVEYSA